MHDRTDLARQGWELLPERLLEAFLTLWRQHGQPLLRSVGYHEIAPHGADAFLIVSPTAGQITSMQLAAIAWTRSALWQGTFDEIKVWRQGRADPLEAGLEQPDSYLAALGLQTSYG